MSIKIEQIANHLEAVRAEWPVLRVHGSWMTGKLAKSVGDHVAAVGAHNDRASTCRQMGQGVVLFDSYASGFGPSVRHTPLGGFDLSIMASTVPRVPADFDVAGWSKKRKELVRQIVNDAISLARSALALDESWSDLREDFESAAQAAHQSMSKKFGEVRDQHVLALRKVGLPEKVAVAVVESVEAVRAAAGPENDMIPRSSSPLWVPPWIEPLRVQHYGRLRTLPSQTQMSSIVRAAEGIVEVVEDEER